MKITKRQLRRIIKEELAEAKRSLNEEWVGRAPQMHPHGEHPYFLAADAHWDHYESRTDVVEYMWHNVMELLGDDHPLSQRIEELIDNGSPDPTDVADEINWAIDDGTAPANLRDSLLALGSFDEFVEK